VQIHFRNYGYIYLIAMAVVMVVMAIIIAFFCRVRCRYQTAKRRILKKVKPMKVKRKEFMLLDELILFYVHVTL
jgi:amino acid transporter